MTNNRGVSNYLVKNFYGGYLNFSLQDAEVDQFTLTEQDKFLKGTVQSDLWKKYPSSRKYSKLFFKKLLNYLEPDHDIHDDFYIFLCNTMSEDIESEKYCYRHYIVDNNFENCIIMKETRNTVVNGTTGMKTWESSLMLTDFILSNKSNFSSKNILELGSGIGFMGIALAKYCKPKLVQMTDCHSDVLKGIRENVKINFPESEKKHNDESTQYTFEQTSIEVLPLDWNNIDKFSNNVKPDVVIGADIVYDPSILDALCSTIKHFFLQNTQVIVYVASIIRNEKTYKCFLQTLLTYDLEATEECYDRNKHLQWDTSLAKSLVRIQNINSNVLI